MVDFRVNPVYFFSIPWLHRSLIYRLVAREVSSRYRESMFGMLWAIFNPIIMLAIYTFVFGYILKVRWPAIADGNEAQFPLILFSGLIVFTVFSETLVRAPGLVLGNVSYVKKVVFPLEILPFVSLGSALFTAIFSFLVWLVANTLVNGRVEPTIVLLPLLLVPLFLISLGGSWLLSSLGVYFRDMAQIANLVATALMFTTPIFYPITLIPEMYRPLAYLNPFVTIIENCRGVMLLGEMPNWYGYSVSLITSTVFAYLSFVWFQRTKRGFADVL